MASERVTPPLSPVRPQRTTLTSATADSLGQAIREGVFKPGTQLPPEKDLMVMLGVSRTTLREALKTLEELRLIVRRHGLGTFVSEKSIVKDLSSNFGITEMIRQAGMSPGSREVDVRCEEASPAVANLLQVHEGDLVYVVDRVRTADGRPAVWSLDYFRDTLVLKEDLETYSRQDLSLYQFLHDRYQLSITYGMAQLYPILADKTMAIKLEVPKGTPLMRITQTDYHTDGQPILGSIEYHLPDLFVFLINRRGPQW